MKAEIVAAIRLRDRHCMSWREIGRALRREHSGIRKAVLRYESCGPIENSLVSLISRGFFDPRDRI